MPWVKPPVSKPERKSYPSDLSDAEWSILEPLLPVTHRRGRERIHTYRDIVDGMLHVLKGAIGWKSDAG